MASADPNEENDNDLEHVRQQASQILEQLRQEVLNLESPPAEWVCDSGGGESQAAAADSSSFACQFLNHTGFLHVPQFYADCQRMKDCMQVVVERDWKPNEQEEVVDSFGTTQQDNQARGDYFLESADRVHFFAEPSALEEDATGRLKAAFAQQKIKALNKVGHALHLLPDSPFNEYCTSPALAQLVLNELHWRTAAVPQSMYIFKNAETGGAVHAHQDSTFLFTEPRQTCLGLWLALDDATLDNGCLWLRPKSHVEPVRRQFCRNPHYFGESAIAQRRNVPSNPPPPSPSDGDSDGGTVDKLIMVPLEPQQQQEGDDGITTTTTTTDNTHLPTPETTPRDLLEQGFVPVECQAGDLLVFVGTLEHLSLPNRSHQDRHTFQLHLVQGEVEWSPSNWLQYPPDKPFLELRQPS